MSSPPQLPAPVRSPVAFSLGAVVCLLWCVPLVVICWPLWLLSIFLMKLSNFCYWAGCRARDGLESLGDKLEHLFS